LKQAAKANSDVWNHASSTANAHNGTVIGAMHAASDYIKLNGECILHCYIVISIQLPYQLQKNGAPPTLTLNHACCRACCALKKKAWTLSVA
jgi:hypothetical protein